MPETQSFVSLSTRIAIRNRPPLGRRPRPARSPCPRPAARSRPPARRRRPRPPARRHASAAPSMVASACTLGRLASASSCRPSLSLVPSRRTTNGTLGLIWSNASIRPRATSSQRVMPPKMLNSTAVTLGSERMHLDRLGDRLRLRAAAGVEEVGRLAARLGDDVERRHHEPGAVAEDADVAVELHVGQPALLGHLLLRVLAAGVAQLGVLGMAEQAVPVERDLGVERLHLALGGDDHRVDLDEHRLLADERVVELGRAARRPGGRRRRRRRPRTRAAGRGSPGSRAAGRRAGGRSRRGCCRRPPRCPCRPASRASPAASWPRGRRRSRRSTRTRCPRRPRPTPRGP